VYRGPYEGLGAAWGELGAWIESEGLGVQDVFWESYIVGPESSPDANDWRTQLNRRLLDR
jgi:effector-binding domain-containing protein